MKKEKVSNAVIRRLPRYYRTLHLLEQEGYERISSSALGSSMGITASQIRQDLSCFGEFGKQGYGYEIAGLLREIADILGMNNHYSAIILGAGNLGRALIRNFSFSANGFTLRAAFDVDPALIGSTIGEVPVYALETLPDYMAAHSIQVGVLTVPRSVAQPMAEKLIDGGVKGIWNFTNMELDVRGSGVTVESVHFADSLLALGYLISDNQKDA
ncbi:MAG: redox-sensing transcriptional repressor Rex [Clostridiales bacterium]|nr:redox-sensing transcriptional repressor Rex [Clostridiales bacterium]